MKIAAHAAIAVLAASGAALSLGLTAHHETAPHDNAEAAADARANASATYEVDPVHSTVLFRIRHAGASNFYGRFNGIDKDKSSFTFDPENPESSSFTFVIDNASVDTGNQDRDNHLRNADFFNVNQFPTTTFKSTSIAASEKGEDTYELEGDLTLHGVTRPITAELKWLGTGSFRGNTVVGFEASFEIQRSDFGMTKYLAEDGGESGGLGNTVGVLIAVEARPAG